VTRPEVTPDTQVCNVEPQGQYNPWFVSKYHLDRGDSTAFCSTSVLLNIVLGWRPTGFGGPLSYGDGYARLGDLERGDVCRKCVPVMPEVVPA